MNSESTPNPRTIHVSSIPTTLDRSALLAQFRALSGFLRVHFHADYCFVTLKDDSSASRAIDDLHRHSELLAAYARLSDGDAVCVNGGGGGGGALASAKLSLASAKPPAASAKPLVTPANPILYCALPAFFNSAEVNRIFSTLPGFDSIRISPSHCLVRFRSTAMAASALALISSQTNLVASFSTRGLRHPNGGSDPLFSTTFPPVSLVPDGPLVASVSAFSLQPPSSSQTHSPSHSHTPPSTLPIIYQAPDSEPSSGTEPQGQNQNTLNQTPHHPNNHSQHLSQGQTPTNRRTIHVTYQSTQKHTLFALLRTIPGFSRIAFYQDYCFVVFENFTHASAAIDEIFFKTGLKANFAKNDYSSAAPSPSAAAMSLGLPNPVVRVSDFPSSLHDSDLKDIFSTYLDFAHVEFFHSSCLVHFTSTPPATAFLDSINAVTNFSAIYSKKGAAMVKAAAQAATTTTAPTSTAGLTLPSDFHTAGAAPSGFASGLPPKSSGFLAGSSPTLRPHSSLPLSTAASKITNDPSSSVLHPTYKSVLAASQPIFPAAIPNSSALSPTMSPHSFPSLHASSTALPSSKSVSAIPPSHPPLSRAIAPPTSFAQQVFASHVGGGPVAPPSLSYSDLDRGLTSENGSNSTLNEGESLDRGGLANGVKTASSSTMMPPSSIGNGIGGTYHPFRTNLFTLPSTSPATSSASSALSPPSYPFPSASSLGSGALNSPSMNMNMNINPAILEAGLRSTQEYITTLYIHIQQLLRDNRLLSLAATTSNSSTSTSKNNHPPQSPNTPTDPAITQDLLHELNRLRDDNFRLRAELDAVRRGTPSATPSAFNHEWYHDTATATGVVGLLDM